MSADWQKITDDEILNSTGMRENATIARYERILQKRMTDAALELRDKLTGLMETAHRASQGLQEKSDHLIGAYKEISESQGRQQKAIIGLSLVVAMSTVAYTWITYESVIAMREANVIQLQLLELQKKSVSAAQPLSKEGAGGSKRGMLVPEGDLLEGLGRRP